MNTLKYSVLAMAACAMAGCSTPASVLEQANHGLSLTSQMEIELKEFRRNEANSEKFLVASVRAQQTVAGSLSQSLRADDLARQAVGDAAAQRIVNNLTAFLQGLADSDAATAQALKTSGATLAALLAPLPSTTAATSDTQLKFAELGKELPWSVRQAEFKTLATTIQKNVKDNKAKIDAARQSQPSGAAAAP